ncbi:hypothetical protein D3C79_877710 [compost metagenome]
MGELQCQQIAGVLDRNPPPDVDCPLPVAIEPGAYCMDMLALALVRLRCQPLCRVQALEQLRVKRFVGRSRYRASAKGVGQGKIRVLRDKGVSCSQGIGLVGMQQVASAIESIDCLLRAIGNRIATLVAFAHGLLLTTP